MKVILPVTIHDSAAFKARNDILIQFGGLQDHEAVIVHSPAAKVVAAQEHDRLRGLFRNIQMVETIDLNFAKPVINQNVLFYATVMNLARLGNKDSFLFLEADAVPTQAGWANKLQNAFLAAGKPYFGNVVEVPFIMNGELVTQSGEEMMMGVGIYPPNMVDLKNPIRALVIDLGKQGNNPALPWDVYLRGEQRRAGWANTDLIADQWNTHKYRSVEGGFECEPMPIDRKVRNRGGFVSSKALIIHGCKDSSLVDLLRQKPVSTPSSALRVSEQPKAPMTPTEPKEIVLTPEQEELKKKVEDRLAIGSLRLNILADELGKEKPALEKELAEVGYLVQRPSGWIKAK